MKIARPNGNCPRDIGYSDALVRAPGSVSDFVHPIHRKTFTHGHVRPFLFFTLKKSGSMATQELKERLFGPLCQSWFKLTTLYIIYIYPTYTIPLYYTKYIYIYILYIYKERKHEKLVFGYLMTSGIFCRALWLQYKMGIKGTTILLDFMIFVTCHGYRNWNINWVL